MDERILFDQFHEALDVEPRPGAYERMRFAMTNQPVALKSRPVFRMRWSKMGIRVAAVLAAAVLAVAVEGRWPDGAADQTKPFRLVLVGNSNFAANSYFPYVSNGDLAVEMVRWLAEDETRPAAKPQSFSPAQQITLTRDQMRTVFIAVEMLLPLSVMLLGGLVWWKRR